MSTQPKAMILLSLILGLLMGGIILILGAYFSGFLNWDNSPADKPISATQGTDWLQNYRCARGETKQLILRGIEDNYNPAGEELVPKSEYVRIVRERGNNGLDYRHYDDPAPDKILFESFQIPSNTAHGIFVTRLKELATVKSDNIAMGNIQHNRSNDYAEFSINELPTSQYWESKGDLYKAQLKDLRINPSSTSSEKPSIKDYIKSAEPSARGLSVRVSDDTQVDFMGFALCLAPKTKMGMAYALRDWDFYGGDRVNAKLVPENYAYLNPTILESKPCHIYTGCYTCEKTLPLACFENQNLEVPEFMSEVPHIWSAGVVRLTEPVRGDQFKTADDTHALCQARFGKSWRTLSTHDGSFEGHIAVKQQTPLPSGAFWIDVKGGEHSNCWEQRPEPASP